MEPIPSSKEHLDKKMYRIILTFIMVWNSLTRDYSLA
jgi:hypothetical protein